MDIMQARYTTITLDMGYTLVDLDSGLDRELVRIAAQEGLAITLDDVRAAERRFWLEQSERDVTATWEPSAAADEAAAFEIDRAICLNVGLREPRVHQAVHELSRRLFNDPATYTVFPDVFTTLKTLRGRGLKLGIISNWGWHLPELCQALALAPYFDFIISSARVGSAKPHPGIFRAALAQAGSPPARMLHVGDSLAADVQGAQALGITGVLLDRCGDSAVADGSPVVSTLAQVPDLL